MCLLFTLTDVIKALKRRVDAEWKYFGTFLHVDPFLLDAIHKNNLANTADCMLDLVSKWVFCKEGTGDLPRTWQTVVEAVKDTGLEPLAKELAEKYGVPLTQQ